MKAIRICNIPGSRSTAQFQSTTIDDKPQNITRGSLMISKHHFYRLVHLKISSANMFAYHLRPNASPLATAFSLHLYSFIPFKLHKHTQSMSLESCCIMSSLRGAYNVRSTISLSRGLIRTRTIWILIKVLMKLICIHKFSLEILSGLPALTHTTVDRSQKEWKNCILSRNRKNYPIANMFQ